MIEELRAFAAVVWRSADECGVEFDLLLDGSDLASVASVMTKRADLMRHSPLQLRPTCESTGLPFGLSTN